MPQDNEQWPGKVEEYRDLLAKAESALASSEAEVYAAGAALMIAAQIAGLTQILDKIAYSARMGSRQ